MHNSLLFWGSFIILEAPPKCNSLELPTFWCFLEKSSPTIDKFVDISQFFSLLLCYLHKFLSFYAYIYKKARPHAGNVIKIMAKSGV